MFTLVNLTCIIFLYKHAKDGLEWPKLFFGKLYFSECTSWNNPNGQKTSLGAIANDLVSSSIICSRFKMFSTNLSLQFSSMTSSNLFEICESSSFFPNYLFSIDYFHLH